MTAAPTQAAVAWRAMRPQQWIKNSFVLAPLMFAGPQLIEQGALTSGLVGQVLLAALAFCLASSATYLLNDLHDIAADRAHPVKCQRPIASGALPHRQAWAVFGALLATALGIGLAVRWTLAATLVGYLVINVAYSKGLKRIAYVDAVVISAGFLLRTVAGGEAARVHLSYWLIGSTMLLALFLALGKRKHELLTSDSGHRAALEQYRMEHLNFALGVLAALAAGSYALYTRDPGTIARFGTDKLLWTLPFVLFGLWRFYQLLDDHTTAQSPTDRMLRDPIFVANGLLTVTAMGVVIYGLGG
ncbi:MAG: hypothetical protein EXR77_17795 [Myxococcales bacterium]|nr:hypothetical protein [Myxococcales bacterium]